MNNVLTLCSCKVDNVKNRFSIEEVTDVMNVSGITYSKAVQVLERNAQLKKYQKK